LRQINEVSAVGFGGGVRTAVFLADFELPQIGYRELTPVLSARVARGSSYGALIGRYILRNYVLTFDGPRGCCMISKPSDAPTSPPDHE
jgi:hypothetical protein